MSKYLSELNANKTFKKLLRTPQGEDDNVFKKFNLRDLII